VRRPSFKIARAWSVKAGTSASVDEIVATAALFRVFVTYVVVVFASARIQTS
jgi:hypothetical protein